MKLNMKVECVTRLFQLFGLVWSGPHHSVLLCEDVEGLETVDQFIEHVVIGKSRLLEQFVSDLV